MAEMPSSKGLDNLRFLVWHSRQAFNKANERNKPRVVDRIIRMFGFQDPPDRYLEVLDNDTVDDNVQVNYLVADYMRVCQFVRDLLLDDDAEDPHSIAADEQSRLIHLLGKSYNPDVAEAATNRQRKRHRKSPVAPAVLSLVTPQTRPNSKRERSARVTPDTLQKRLFESSASDVRTTPTKRRILTPSSEPKDDLDSTSSVRRRRSFEDEDSLPDDASFGEWCDFISSHLAARRQVATNEHDNVH